MQLSKARRKYLISYGGRTESRSADVFSMAFRLTALGASLLMVVLAWNQSITIGRKSWSYISQELAVLGSKTRDRTPYAHGSTFWKKVFIRSRGHHQHQKVREIDRPCNQLRCCGSKANVCQSQTGTPTPDPIRQIYTQLRNMTYTVNIFLNLKSN